MLESNRTKDLGGETPVLDVECVRTLEVPVLPRVLTLEGLFFVRDGEWDNRKTVVFCRLVK